jgi:hypothetical protein
MLTPPVEVEVTSLQEQNERQAMPTMSGCEFGSFVT